MTLLKSVVFHQQIIQHKVFCGYYTGHPKQRSTTPRNVCSPKPGESRDAEKQFIQKLKEKCDEQSRQLSNIRDELKRTSCGFDVFAITTQHFFRQKENALVKISELGAEIEKIREEVAISTEKWKKIQNEKEDLEQYLEKEVTKLHAQQKEELQMLEQRLFEDYSMKIKSLQEQQTLQLDLVKAQHLQQVSSILFDPEKQTMPVLSGFSTSNRVPVFPSAVIEQVSSITAAHTTSVQELESKHRNSLIVLQDEHEHKIQELIAAHELEKTQLKESFEKMRLCLQVEKKLILEEKITVLQQQNEELRARIEQNTVKTSTSNRVPVFPSAVIEQVSNITAAHTTSVQELESKHRNSLIVLQDEHEHKIQVQELESKHRNSLIVLQDEHEHKIQELIAAHELEKTQLKESFEKMRLCLQDQIDTLTFQNQSLKDKANLFEEAFNKNNEEQIKLAKAPYLHLEEDLRSLKHVLELKNHQIHEQDRRIMDLEKQVEKKLILEEKITVLQQQNEELRARIEQNTVKTRFAEILVLYRSLHRGCKF
ncbi:UNVERIFIED_CONTAM: hypothetical protein H355_001627 [Colinus virginianus]|nr:hypothetical protein H355_001627 [Colinus virginianus]